MSRIDDWLYKKFDHDGRLEHAEDWVKGFDGNDPLLSVVRLVWCLSQTGHSLINVPVACLELIPIMRKEIDIDNRLVQHKASLANVVVKALIIGAVIVIGRNYLGV